MARLKIVILITIIALMLIVALLALSSARLNANAKQRLTDISLVAAALSDYFQDNNAYPYGKGIPNGLDLYLDRWPTPPPPMGSCVASTDQYSYSQQYSGADYTVNFCLSAKTGGYRAGQHILTSKGIQ